MFIDNNTENERLKKGMGSHMTAEDKKMLDRINEYANRVLKSNDSKNARVSYQLDKLKPVMQKNRILRWKIFLSDLWIWKVRLQMKKES